MKEIRRTPTSQKKNLSFEFDAMGNQVAKHIINNQTGLLERSTYYILDAQGNQMSVYEHEVDNSNVLYTLKERHIYGSSHLGTFDDSVSMYNSNVAQNQEHLLGHKFYSLSDHRSNVNTVISDIKVPLTVDGITVSGYQAYSVNIADFSPFNVELDGRILYQTKSSGVIPSGLVGFNAFQYDLLINFKSNNRVTKLNNNSF